MRAIKVLNFNESTVEEVPTPEPGSNEVLIEVERVQLSVTECNLFRGEEITHYERIKRRLSGEGARLFGHEFCGTVVELGRDVEDLSIGHRVYAPGKIPCHGCRFCEGGYEIYCPNKTYIGYDIPGALSEYVALPVESLCKVPDEVSNAEVAALQPLASAVLCVQDAGISFGDVVAVLGCGVMGYQSAQLALTAGADTVFAVDIDSKKLEIAEDRGLVPIHAIETDPVEEVKSRTDGIGADVCIEAVGGHQNHATEGSDPIAQAMQMARTGGSVVQIGYVIGDLTITPRVIRSKSIDWKHPLRGVVPLGPNRDTGNLAAELVASGRVSLKEYITHELEGLESFEDAVEITLNKEAYGARGPAQIIVE